MDHPVPASEFTRNFGLRLNDSAWRGSWSCWKFEHQLLQTFILFDPASSPCHLVAVFDPKATSSGAK